MTTRAQTIVGYDTTTDAMRPTAVCAECGDASDGEPIHDGDEWGGVPDGGLRCVRCFREIPVIDPARNAEDE
jgi:hypothetical protein